MHEHQVTRQAGRGASFLTLTYDPPHLPADVSVNVRDWQLFAKRLRKARGSFRFFMCAEYGDRTLRPHYHAIVFGHDFADDRVSIKPGEFGDLYFSPSLQLLWGKGQCSVGEVTFQSCAYVARYCMKKATGPLAGARYRRRDGDRSWSVKPEFCTMSRGGRGGEGGIGSRWIRQFKGDIYPSDETILNGKRMRTPRFYDSFLTPAELEAVKAKRMALGLERASDLTRERLEAREYILRSRSDERGSL